MMTRDQIVAEAEKIDGWMSREELQVLADAASTRKIIIEVGSWMGRSTTALALATPGRVYAVDHWQGSENERELMAKASSVPLGDPLYQKFCKNTEKLIASGKIVPVRCDSANAVPKLLELLAGQKADMVFIDGEHTYEACRRDIKTFRPLIKPGGILYGHDYSEGFPGVMKAANELPIVHTNDTAIWKHFVRPWVYAYWWRGDNFGDLLTPYLIEKISGKKAVWTFPDVMRPCYLATGSNLTLGPMLQYCTVWGAGIHDPAAPIPTPPRDIRAVRGPHSKRALEKAGFSCPGTFGDPGLLLPRLYRPTITSKKPLGLIPHWTDLIPVYEAYGASPDISVINLHDPVESVITQINSCQNIISSSLHGLIVADAYGIPNRWAEFGDNVPGRGVKFRDYYDSIGGGESVPVDLRTPAPMLMLLDLVKRHTVNLDLDALWKACPFLP